MDIGRIAIRALIAYIYLLFNTRASGKRVIAQATPFDLVVSIAIGDLIDDALWAEVPVAKFGAAVAAILVCDAVVKFSAYHSNWLFRLVQGAPVAVVRDGYEDRAALRGEQMNEADLAHLLRLNGIDEDRSKVQLALVERDHEISVMLKPEAEPAQRRDAPRVLEKFS